MTVQPINKHYRVDKMSSIALLEMTSMPRERMLLNSLIYGYILKKSLACMAVKKKKITLKLKNSLVGVMLEQIGNHIFISKCDEEHIYVRLKVGCQSTVYRMACWFWKSSDCRTQQFG